MNSIYSPIRAGTVLFLASCLQVALPQPLTAQSSTAPSPSVQTGHAPAHRITVIGISNFAEVTPKLYRGGQPVPAGYDKLKKMGVDIVVDLRLSGKDTEEKRVTQAGMQFVTLPWHCLRPRDEVFARFLMLLRENPEKKIFVHCRYGDDRTGMVIAAYRMAVQGWTWQEAREEMNKFGFHHSLCVALVRYEKSFPERLKNNSAFEEWRAASKSP